MDKVFKRYLTELREDRPDMQIPNFCSVHSKSADKKRILAVLQDPGNSSPETTKECSIEINKDPTARRQKAVLEEVGVNPTEVLFWNFFPFFGFKKCSSDEKIYWADQLRRLCELLINLRVILVSGNEAVEGMKKFKPIVGVAMVRTPHPSNLGVKLPGKMEELMDGWEKAKRIIGDR